MAKMPGNTIRSRDGNFCGGFTMLCRSDPSIEPLTVSEAIARASNSRELTSLVPGSWINANFNVWIGAPEDNRAWDYLYHARDFLHAGCARMRPKPNESWHSKSC